MWLFTTIGFYSVTQVREKPEILQIRARVKGDLDNLRAKYLPELTETVQLPGRDYPYRAYTDRPCFAAAMVQIITDLSHHNFKDEVLKQQGLAREQLYHDVWHVMYDAERKLEEKERKNKTRYSTQASFGAFDDFWERYRSSADDSGPFAIVEPTPAVTRRARTTEADNAAEAQEFLRKEDTKRSKKGARPRRRTR